MTTAERIISALGGRNGMAKCPAHNDHTPSLSITQREGKVLVHCFSGCEQHAVIAALKARGLWPQRDRPGWTPAQRTRWAREQAELQRDLPAARYWRRAAVALGEEVLDRLKAAGAVAELQDWTARIARWKGIEGGELVADYRWRREHERGMVAALVRAAMVNQKARQRAILAYVETIPKEAA